MIRAFGEKYESLNGRVHLVENIQAGAQWVATLVRDAGANCLAVAGVSQAWQSAIVEHVGSAARLLVPPFEIEDLPQALDAAQVGVTAADFGIVETGALVEVAQDDAVRLTSTLPRTHICLLRADQLVETLAEAAPRLRQVLEQKPQHVAISFISGPSRTGDIEMKLILGVHGPERSHVILFDGE